MDRDQKNKDRISELVERAIATSSGKMKERKSVPGSHHVTGTGSSAIRKEHEKRKKIYEDENE